MADAAVSSTVNDPQPSEASDERLSDIFDKALSNYNQLQMKRSVTNDAELESEVKKCMEQFEFATRLVSAAGVFSSNETVEDLSTESLKYLLLPALLGHLTLRLISGSRREIVTVAEVYFRDFIERCKEYEITDVKLPLHQEEGGMHPTVEAQVYVLMTSREEKIKRYNMQKELTEKLRVLEATIKSENVDDSSKRDYYMTLIKLNTILGIDELKFIKSELPLIEMAENIHLKKNEPVVKPRKPTKPLQPYIITKNEAQKAVFGAGYPSMPVYTVEEFYEKRVQEGTFPGGDSCSTSKARAPHKNGVEDNEDDRSYNEQSDDDDPAELKKARDMDEFKDDHKRGEGNRYNRS